MIRLASLFQDGAILQRDRDIPVWGWGRAGSKITVSFDGNISCGRCASDGSFMIYLPAHAAGGPFELTVSDGDDTVSVKDVLTGEVWLASGQSNMEYALGSDWRAQVPDQKKEPVGRVQQKQFNEMLMDAETFRVFTVEQNASGAKESTCGGAWQKMSPENSASASAVAAWFGLGLQYQLGVPVGIIVSAWGGTVAESWMSYEALNSLPETAEVAANSRSTHWIRPDRWGDREKSDVDTDALEGVPGLQKDPGNQGEKLGYAEPDFDDSSWQNMEISGSWISQNIAENGAVWVRKSVDIPNSWAGQPLMLVGGAVDKHDISYFNGHEIGRTGKDLETNWYNVPRCYRISGDLVKGGKNVIAIRAFSFAYDGAFTGEWFLCRENASETDHKIHLCGTDWRAKAEFDLGVVRPFHNPLTFGPGNSNTPAILFDGMINPLIPYSIRGCIWYQGESNTTSIERSKNYRDVLQAMIDDWRKRFRDPSMAFLVVQLAGYGKPECFCEKSTWAELRESQRMIAKYDPDTYMASALDVGEPLDIHPENKLDVGKRLAMCALHNVYGCENIVPSGPEPISCERLANMIVVKFKYADGMELRSGADAFFVSDSSGAFFPADEASVHEDTLSVVSHAVKEPCSIRYAWSNCPNARLFNKAGFPASSFNLEIEN